jgi:hypothetical protein
MLYSITSGTTTARETQMQEAEKVRENRLRRAAARQGLRLEKSRRRDPRALGYGTYQLVNERTNQVTAGDLTAGYGLTLEDVERALTQ